MSILRQRQRIARGLFVNMAWPLSAEPAKRGKQQSRHDGLRR